MDSPQSQEGLRKRKEPLPVDEGKEDVCVQSTSEGGPIVAETAHKKARLQEDEGEGTQSTKGKFAGEDSGGSVYESEQALWRSLRRETAEGDNSESDEAKPWYKGSEDYWAKVEPTLDGVLGGFGFLSAIDIKTSRAFLSSFIPAVSSSSSSPSVSSSSSSSSLTPIGTACALDCGAGIGRITRHLLLDLFDRVDLVEPDSRFLDKAKQQLGPLQPLNGHRVEGFFCEGLQSFVPEKGRYDLIWIQWVIGYLTDEDFVSFLRRCAEALRENGIVVIKDNLNSKEGFYVDKEDNSITRSDGYLRTLFAEARLELVKEGIQEEFPPGMLPVRMYALRTK